MAIAWTTVATLVLLLPGFLFFTGLHSKSRFSRDTTPKSAIGQLAAIVLVAFCVHVVLVWVTRVAGTLWTRVPQVDFRLVLSALQAGTAGGASIEELSRAISRHVIAIPAYVGASAALGFLVGRITAHVSVEGPFRFLLEHAWVYELVPRADRLAASTYAYVLTRLTHDGRYVLYRGPLHQFALGRDGRFAYVVLRRAERFYLALDGEAPTTTAKQARIIGTSWMEPDSDRLEEREIDYLYVDAQEISNIVFERYAFVTPGGATDAIATIRRAGAETEP